MLLDLTTDMVVRGQLFQNRYKSIICQEETYLRELVRYIHLNPIRAGIVQTLDELKSYKYCGHSSLMGKTKRQWQDTDYVLGYFGKSKTQARKEYESFVKDGLKQGRKDELTGGGLIRSLGGWTEAREALKGGVHIMSDERILGDSDFVDSVISQSEEHYERRHRLKRQGYDLDRIAERVSEVLGMKPDEVFSKGRQDRKVKARSLLCFWAARELGMSHTALGQEIGDEFSRRRIFSGERRINRKRGQLFTRKIELLNFKRASPSHFGARKWRSKVRKRVLLGRYFLNINRTAWSDPDRPARRPSPSRWKYHRKFVLDENHDIDSEGQHI